MLDELRQRIARYLDTCHTAVLSSCGWGQPWSLPVQYRHLGLEIECLLPRWTELISHLPEDPEVLLVILDKDVELLRWLEYRGGAVLLNPQEWTGWELPHGEREWSSHSYAVLRLAPRRIDLVDGSRGWGFRETLDF